MRKLKKIFFMFYMRLKYKNSNIYGDLSMRSVLHGENYLGIGSYFDGNMGYASCIGNRCEILALIGKYTCIGHDVRTIIATHPLNPNVSIHPIFFSTRDKSRKSYVKKQIFNEYKYADDKNKYGVIIGNDVWIGDRVTILGGIKIADGAVIAAGSVVTHDIPPYNIVGGVPARKIKERFSKTQIEKLCEFEWWNKSENWLINNAASFNNIDLFIDIIETEQRQVEKLRK